MQNGLKISSDLLYYAAMGSNEIVLKLIVDSGINIHDNNHCAIITAAEYGNLDAFKYLDSKGAILDVNDNIPALWASGNSHHHIVKYIVDRKIDISKVVDEMLVAACRNYKSTSAFIEFLVTHGATLIITIIWH